MRPGGLPSDLEFVQSMAAQTDIVTRHGDVVRQVGMQEVVENATTHTIP